MSVSGAGERVEPAGSGLELGFVDGGGVERRAPLAACAEVRLEDGMPVRQFRWSRGLGHFPGWWWAATTGRHVGYESWLERDHVRALDFDPEITGIASQPFWLYWTGERGRRRGPLACRRPERRLRARPQPRQYSQSVLGMLIEPCRSVATKSSRRIVI